MTTAIEVLQYTLKSGSGAEFHSIMEDATADVKVALTTAGTPIGPNDTAIAGHAIAAGVILVTNNVREFKRVPNLVLEDWVNEFYK